MVQEIVVVKRDGTKAKFDDDKIFQAILSSFSDVYEGKITKENTNDILDLTEAVVDRITPDDGADYGDDTVEDFGNKDDDGAYQISVDVIQDAVMDALLRSDFNDVAKSYIQYAERRKQQRLDQMNVAKSVLHVLDSDPTVVNENGNKDSRKLTVRRDLIAGQVFRAMGLQMLPPDVREAHLKGDIHWHDLDFSPLLPYANCCNVNLEDMLQNGFHMGEVSITQPHSINVAVQLTVQVLSTVSSQQYGKILPY